MQGMKKQNNNVFSSQYPSGIAFVGSILVGISIGLLHKEDMGAFSLLGVGVGFLLVAIISLLNRNRHLNR
jgi:hypothetical protein